MVNRADVHKTVNELKQRITSIYQHLHAHPEVSWKEYETTRYIQSLFEADGHTVQTFNDMTGVVVTIGDGKPCVAIRADMDALWQEVDGQLQANHSCGHDAHMTIAIGVYLTLQKLQEQQKIQKQLPGKLKFIFQPAEEKGAGALKIIEKGVLDDVDYLYGVHLRPIQECRYGEASPGLLHGAAQYVSGEIVGEDLHGARPHLGANAIEVGAHIVNHLKTIHLDPMVPYSIKMTRFQAGGESSNIIPGSAKFSIDLRAQTNEVMAEMKQQLENIMTLLAEVHQVEIRLKWEGQVAAAEIDADAENIMAAAIADVLGKEKVKQTIVTSGGEDFHFYSLKCSHVKATMLGLGCDLQPGLHHPQMTFNEEALFDGIQILTHVILRTFEQYD